MPNLFVILILYIGLFTNRTLGLTYGVVLGILLDLFIGKKIGITAIMLGAVGIMAALFDKNFSKDSRMTMMIMVAVSTIIYEIGMYILNYIFFAINIEIVNFAEILIVEVIYNIIITIISLLLLKLLKYLVFKFAPHQNIYIKVMTLEYVIIDHVIKYL